MVSPIKKQTVKNLKENLAKTTSFFLVNHKFLKVNDITMIRRELGRNNAALKVIKNRLLKIALKDKSIDFPEENYRNETSVVFCYDDPITIAKLINKYIKQKLSIEVKAGYFENRIIDIDEFKKIASILSRPELLSKLAGTLRNPLTKFCVALKNPTMKLVVVLKQISENKNK